MPVILPNKTDIYGITDEGLSLGRSLEEVSRALLGAGVRILQYREKKMHDGEMLEKCRMLRRVTQEYDACFIVDDHVDLAMLAQADGIHVGQQDIPLADVRSLVGSSMCIGVSTNEPEQALSAQKGGADYIGVGPIYATATKKDAAMPVGLAYLDWVAANISVPYVCIGGIKTQNIGEICRHGGYCCALVSELVSAKDVAGAVERVRCAMHG